MSAEYLSKYWTSRNWRAHLLHWDGKVAGFALLEDSDAVAGGMDIADLFVMRRFRRIAIASKVVEHFMARRSVPWTVAVFEDAADAKRFRKLILQIAHLSPTRQVPDPDGRAATAYVLEPNLAAYPLLQPDERHVNFARLGNSGTRQLFQTLGTKE